LFIVVFAITSAVMNKVEYILTNYLRQKDKQKIRAIAMTNHSSEMVKRCSILASEQFGARLNYFFRQRPITERH